MQDLIWAGPALRDLQRVDAWLLDNAGPDIAADYVAKILDRSNFIRDFPLTGSAYGRGMRKSRVTGTPYLLIYRTLRHRIDILRIRHDRENWRTS